MVHGEFAWWSKMPGRMVTPDNIANYCAVVGNSPLRCVGNRWRVDCAHIVDLHFARHIDVVDSVLATCPTFRVRDLVASAVKEFLEMAAIHVVVDRPNTCVEVAAGEYCAWEMLGHRCAAIFQRAQTLHCLAG